MKATDAAGRPLSIQTIDHQGLTWVNVERPTLAEMSYLSERFRFHPLSLDDCLSWVQLPKLDEHSDHLFLVMHFPEFDHGVRLTRPRQVSIFVGATYVVTVHGGELRPLAKLFQDCRMSDERRGQTMGRGSGLLLYHILDVLVDHCFPILNAIIGSVDQVEGRMFDRREGAVLRDLALLRRDILAYRRIVRPQIEVLEAMEAKEYPSLKVEEEVYFGDLADHMRKLRVELEDLWEVVDGLHETYDSLTSQMTNTVMRILTVFASLILPFLVVSSLYGMNVHLPMGGSPWAFLVLLGIMGILSLALLAFFRLRRWV
ncbi:MAG: magnesium transporter CorA family protein [Chloroflexi bacterium]|nr:magnesium transporter CorA family protein [Chloroflexota bacterium]